MVKNGVIFKDESDEVWLGIYENGTVTEFNELPDYNGIYEDLAYTKITLVNVKDEGHERVEINNICTLQLGQNSNDEFEPVGVANILLELNFPSDDSDDMFVSFLSEMNVLH